MDSKLTIAYAGTLVSYQPGQEKLTLIKQAQQYFWEYYPKNCFHYTRSGYFLFMGLRRFKDKYPELSNRISVQLWGNIDRTNQRQVDSLDISNMVEISGRVTKAATIDKLYKSDVLYLPLEASTPDFSPLYIPGKTFELLSMNKPILALVDRSEVYDLLSQTNQAIIISPFDSDAIAEGIKYLLENKCNLPYLFDGNEYYINQFSFDNTAKKIANVFDSLTQPSEI